MSVGTHEYLMAKPNTFTLSTGETVDVSPGDVLSADEVESWGESVVNRLISGNAIVPVPLLRPQRSPELVAAGSSMGVEGGSGDAAAPAATDGSYPQHKGGGMYVLSDGSEVKGRQKAIAAEAALAE
jgi:hypothetical protein